MKTILCCIFLTYIFANGEDGYNHEFAVELVEGKSFEILKDFNEYHLEVVRQVNTLGNVYHVRQKEHVSKTSELDHIIKKLQKHPSIRRVEQQIDLDVEKKPDFKDIYTNTEFQKQSRKKSLSQINKYKQKVFSSLLQMKKNAVDDDSTYELDPELFPMEDVDDDEDDDGNTDEFFKDYGLSDDDKYYLELVRQRQDRLKDIHFNDPQADRLWQYNNYGQFHSMNPGLDMNIYSVYKANYTGEGVVVTVIDDGLDTRHRDITRNYDPAASMDFNNPHTYVASPRGPTDRRRMPADEGHGTMCASVIGGVANNNFCAHGVAFNVNLGGIRMLAVNMVTDLLEAYALTHNNQYISIYSNSWGPKDSGFLTAPVPHYVSKAFEIGANEGRGGKGSIFLFAAGNGGFKYDHCGADGLVNNPFTFAITAVNIYGRKPAYTEECPAISIATAVGGYGLDDVYYQDGSDPPLITSFINGKCAKRFVGTSAAVPMAAGCIALALEANPKLSWRDVQHLMYISARIPNTKDTFWQLTTAGLLVSAHYGPGLLDCAALVDNAVKWRSVGPRRSCIAESTDNYNVYDPLIRVKRRTRLTFKTAGCAFTNGAVDVLEHVRVHTKIAHHCRGDLTILLTSPTGTKSYLLKNRRYDENNKTVSFSFLSLMHWGEKPLGAWHFDIFDSGLCDNAEYLYSGDVTGIIHNATLEFYGTKESESAGHLNKKLIADYQKAIHVKVPKKSYILNEGQLYEIFNEQRKYFINVSPPDRKHSAPVEPSSGIFHLFK